MNVAPRSRPCSELSQQRHDRGLRKCPPTAYPLAGSITPICEPCTQDSISPEPSRSDAPPSEHALVVAQPMRMVDLLNILPKSNRPTTATATSLKPTARDWSCRQNLYSAYEERSYDPAAGFWSAARRCKTRDDHPPFPRTTTAPGHLPVGPLRPRPLHKTACSSPQTALRTSQSRSSLDSTSLNFVPRLSSWPEAASPLPSINLSFHEPHKADGRSQGNTLYPRVLQL